ncbi:MAG: DUF2163 domain-containing protein [Fimbriimonadaceae bacterium]|nr:DUF2163 domain-containing protein [Fimbriimonadaceae bacterium]QYK56679.1 MAG: DUF2163 domain-containing protein [Fimbriimonadaceae bacterium]
MPRTVPAGLLAAIESESFEPAVLVLVTRKDGTKLGFTSADEPVTFGGDVYEPTDGLRHTEIQSRSGNGVDNLDILGSLSSARISGADLVAGAYDGARIAVRVIDRRDVAAGAALLHVGFIGEVTSKNGEFRAEVRSLSHLLKQNVGDVTSKACRVRRLGDAQCKVNLSGNTVGGVPICATKTLSGGSGVSLTFGSDSAPTGHYSNGIVKFTSGPNSGIEREVKTHALSSGNAVIELRTPFPFAVTAGETALLEAGCDRLVATCRSKFANANNFHGEPDLPGNDKVLKRGRPPRS